MGMRKMEDFQRKGHQETGFSFPSLSVAHPVPHFASDFTYPASTYEWKAVNIKYLTRPRQAEGHPHTWYWF